MPKASYTRAEPKAWRFAGMTETCRVGTTAAERSSVEWLRALSGLSNVLEFAMPLRQS